MWTELRKLRLLPSSCKWPRKHVQKFRAALPTGFKPPPQLPRRDTGPISVALSCNWTNSQMKKKTDKHHREDQMCLMCEALTVHAHTLSCWNILVTKTDFFKPMIFSAKCQAFGWTPDRTWLGKTGAMKHNPSQCCKVDWLLLCLSAWRKTWLHYSYNVVRGILPTIHQMSAFSSTTRRQLYGADLQKLTLPQRVERSSPDFM